MKQEKGMSYIMLCIYIIIIIAVIIGIIYFIKNQYQKEEIETTKTSMLTLQSKIKILSEEVLMKKEGANYIGKKVSDNLEDETIKQLIEKEIIVEEDGNYDNYYILEKDEFEQLNLQDSNLKKVIVNYKTCEIIDLEGFTINNETYYRLSDFKEENKLNNEEGEKTE